MLESSTTDDPLIRSSQGGGNRSDHKMITACKEQVNNRVIILTLDNFISILGNEKFSAFDESQPLNSLQFGEFKGRVKKRSEQDPLEDDRTFNDINPLNSSNVQGDIKFSINSHHQTLNDDNIDAQTQRTDQSSRKVSLESNILSVNKTLSSSEQTTDDEQEQNGKAIIVQHPSIASQVEAKMQGKVGFSLKSIFVDRAQTSLLLSNTSTQKVIYKPFTVRSIVPDILKSKYSLFSSFNCFYISNSEFKSYQSLFIVELPKPNSIGRLPLKSTFTRSTILNLIDLASKCGAADMLLVMSDKQKKLKQFEKIINVVGFMKSNMKEYTTDISSQKIEVFHFRINPKKQGMLFILQ